MQYLGHTREVILKKKMNPSLVEGEEKETVNTRRTHKKKKKEKKKLLFESSITTSEYIYMF